MAGPALNNKSAAAETATPLASVILTVFKRTRYLENAIRSVMRQTLNSFELIVTDDANTEAARQICRQFAGDPRFRYRSNPRALGAPLNVAAALREARGKYVCILNDDDLLEPEMLERLIKPLEQNKDCVLAFSNYAVIDGHGERLPELTTEHMCIRSRQDLSAGIVERPFDFALRHGVMVVMGAVFRRDACNPAWLVPEVAGAYDYWLAINLARQRGSFYFVPEMLLRYRIHKESESARISPEKLICEVFIFQTLFEAPLSDDARRFVRSNLAHYLYLLGRDRLLYGGQPCAARLAIGESLRIRFCAMGAFAWIISFLPVEARSVLIETWLIFRRNHSGRPVVGHPEEVTRMRSLG